MLHLLLFKIIQLIGIIVLTVNGRPPAGVVVLLIIEYLGIVRLVLGATTFLGVSYDSGISVLFCCPIECQRTVLDFIGVDGISRSLLLEGLTDTFVLELYRLVPRRFGTGNFIALGFV